MIYNNNMYGDITKDVHTVKDFESIKVRDGEGPTPSAFARPILGLRDDLSKLDQAIQYIGKTAAMISTDNTMYLGHFTDTADLEITDLNFTEIGQTDSHISDDYRFNGMFCSFVNDTNLVSSIQGLDSSMKSNDGWTYSGNNDARCSFAFSKNGMSIKNHLRRGAKNACELAIFPVGKYIDVTKLSIPVLSMLVRLSTVSDVDLNKCKIAVGFYTCKADKSRIAYNSVEVKDRSFKGPLKLENVTYDPKDVAMIEPVITISFFEQYSYVNATLKDMCIVNATYISCYSRSSNSGTGIIYSHAVDTTCEQSTVYERILLTKEYFRNSKKRFGGMFLIDTERDLELSALATGTGFRLVISRISDNYVIMSSTDTIQVADTDFEKYCALGFRFGKDIDEVQMFFVNADGLISHVSINYTDSKLGDRLYDLALGAYRDTTYNIEGQITELRYDKEWLNDQQILALTNCQIAFQNKDSSSLTSNTIYAILDAIEVNMIKNPDGRFNQYHWSNFPPIEKFHNVVGNPLVGSGWVWVGGPSGKELMVNADIVAINPDKQLRFRSKVKSVSGSIGTYGIGFAFYADANGANAIGQPVLAKGKHNRDLEYIECEATPPPGALFAKAFMYMGSAFMSSEAYWTKLKLEQGDHATMFTDDSSPKHALYAP